MFGTPFADVGAPKEAIEFHWVEYHSVPIANYSSSLITTLTTASSPCAYTARISASLRSIDRFFWLNADILDSILYPLSNPL
ncbi:MAG: hypothetical protein HC769_14910 [Cyanobacteria bacterium CRU_2_1]|nr:hypothetical protein [Cyanobacteria bacterium CRU_2_1]